MRVTDAIPVGDHDVAGAGRVAHLLGDELDGSAGIAGDDRVLDVIHGGYRQRHRQRALLVLVVELLVRLPDHRDHSRQRRQHHDADLQRKDLLRKRKVPFHDLRASSYAGACAPRLATKTTKKAAMTASLPQPRPARDRKSTRLNSSHITISYAV